MSIGSRATQQDSSPFHRGEREIQERLGVRERLDQPRRPETLDKCVVADEAGQLEQSLA